MVRRVGFGDDGDHRSKSSKARADKPAMGEKRTAKSSSRFLVGAFLLIWLTIWSGAIAFSVYEIIDQGLGAADIGLFIWVAFASLFWLLAVHMLWRVVTGRPLGRGATRAANLRKHGRNGGRGDWDHGEND